MTGSGPSRRSQAHILAEKFEAKYSEEEIERLKSILVLMEEKKVLLTGLGNESPEVDAVLLEMNRQGITQETLTTYALEVKNINQTFHRTFKQGLPDPDEELTKEPASTASPRFG